VGTTHYIYDLDGNLIAEAFGATAATAVLVREYIWLEGMPVMAIDGVNTATPVLYAVHTDHLTRPIRLTNSAKAQVWNAQWLPWGGAHSVTGTVAQSLRFPAQYFLIEQGLSYNWHRFYDQTTGRYTQPDPLGFPDGPARYAYALNSPLMYVDEDGQVGLVGFFVGGGLDLGMQLIANGGRLKCVRWGQVLGSAAIGAISGGLGGRGLTNFLSGLGNRTKGNIGEAVAIAKNLGRGRIPVGFHRRIPGQRAHYDARYRTITGRTVYGEAKFGTSGLTSAQRAAQRALGGDYQVVKWTPFLGPGA
jgi:RHS repeat-associated protein